MKPNYHNMNNQSFQKTPFGSTGPKSEELRLLDLQDELIKSQQPPIRPTQPNNGSTIV